MSFAIFLVSSFSFAQEYKPEPLKAVPPGDDKIVSIKEGDKAQFAGQLFSSDTALRWANFLEQAHVRLRVDVERERAIAAAKERALEERLRLEKQRSELLLSEYQKQIDRLTKPDPWYKSPVVPFMGGVLTMTIVTVTVVVLVSKN